LVQVTANVANATQMMVGTDAGFTGAIWQPYQPQFNWTLRDTGGRIATLLVYARFSDAGGAPLCSGAQLIDDVIYDPVPPSLSVAMNTTTAAAQPSEAHGATVVLNIAANDQENGSGVAAMEISPDESFSESTWQPFSIAPMVEAEAGQTLYVRVMDGTGNVSPVVTVTVPGAVEPPSGVYLPSITR
jgi:hypothetical protein